MVSFISGNEYQASWKGRNRRHVDTILSCHFPFYDRKLLTMMNEEDTWITYRHDNSSLNTVGQALQTQHCIDNHWALQKHEIRNVKWIYVIWGTPRNVRADSEEWWLMTATTIVRTMKLTRTLPIKIPYKGSICDSYCMKTLFIEETSVEQI